MWVRRILIAALVLGVIGAAIAFSGVGKSALKYRYLKSGQKYAAQGLWREATIQYLNALSLDPRFVDAHYQLAKLAQRVGDNLTASQEFQSTIELSPDNMDAQLQVGKYLLEEGDLQGAEQKADLVLARKPNDPEVHLLLARFDDAVGYIEDSQDEIDKAIRLAPSNPAPYVVVANMRAAVNDADGAEAAFQQALKLDPKQFDVLLSLGSLYELQQHWPDAEKAFRDAAAAAPTDVSPWTSLAFLYLAQRQLEPAEHTAEEAASKFPNEPDAYRMLPDVHLSVGLLDKAAPEYAALFKKHPRDVAVMRRYGQTLLLQDNYAEAQRVNDTMMRIAAGDPNGQVQQAQLMIHNSRADDAKRVLLGVLRVQPGDPDAHYQLGFAMQALGDLAGAQREFQEAEQLAPESSNVQLALALLAARKGDIVMMSNATRQMLKVAPGSNATAMVRAMTAFAAGRLDEADAGFRSVMQNAPQRPIGYLRLGELRVVQKRYLEAMQLLEQALDRDPAQFEAMQVLAALYVGQNQRDKAMERVQKQLAKLPDDSNLHFLLGTLLMGKSDLQGAELEFERATAANKKNNEAWRLLGQCRGIRGQSDAAIAAYELWGKSSPDDARSYLGLGELYDQRGNWQKAQSYYYQSLRLDPDNGAAANNLAYSLLEHNGDVAQAFNYAVTARAQMPDSAITADTIGWAYYHKGVYKDAVAALEQAVTQNPNSATVHYHLGLAYQRMHDTTRAREHLQKVLQLDPQYSHAEDVYKALQELMSTA